MLNLGACWNADARGTRSVPFSAQLGSRPSRTCFGVQVHPSFREPSSNNASCGKRFKGYVDR